jgi:hypothetical protein
MLSGFACAETAQSGNTKKYKRDRIVLINKIDEPQHAVRQPKKTTF